MWTVFKVSALFYFLVVFALVVAGVILWNIASAFGVIVSIQKSVRTLFDLKTYVLHPGPVLLYGAGGGIVVAIAGILVNTLAALFYNLISDVIGGVQLVVVTETD